MGCDTSDLHVNYQYVLDWVRAHASAGAKVLDYGCGGGDVVEAGRRDGLDIYGVELFYAGSHARKKASEKGLLGTWVRELDDGQRSPFPDAWFDVVVTNQVLEHVEDIDAVLDEIRRVLRPDGRLLALFPSRGVVREGHIGVPFVHWFSSRSRVRRGYTAAARRLGLGYFKDGQTVDEWVDTKLHWLDQYTFYRSRSQIHAAFSQRFVFRHAEATYAAYRLRGGAFSMASHAVTTRLVAPLAAALIRTLGGYVIEGRRG